MSLLLSHLSLTLLNHRKRVESLRSVHSLTVSRDWKPMFLYVAKNMRIVSDVANCTVMLSIVKGKSIGSAFSYRVVGLHDTVRSALCHA